MSSTSPRGLTVVNRALFDADLDFRRNEFALAYDGERAALQAAYVYLAEDDSNPFLGPSRTTNELSLDARYRVHPNWEVRGLWRYDLAQRQQPARRGRHHLRQRVRRVRPFGLAPLHLIG